MFEYIKGVIVELSPACVVLESNKIGYFVNVSLNSYAKFEVNKEYKIYLHQVIKEDSNKLYGFAEKEERIIFRHLISVSGIGANTAIVMLSSLSPDEIKSAICSDNVNVLKGVKGIGAKTAQRVIIDLKDKLSKLTSETSDVFNVNDNRSEALEAMLVLGFMRKSVEKVIDSLLKTEPNLTIEELVKKSLKKL